MKQEGILDFRFRNAWGGEWNVTLAREYNYHPIKVEFENMDGSWEVRRVEEWFQLPNSTRFIPTVIKTGTYRPDKKQLLPGTETVIRMEAGSFKTLDAKMEGELFALSFSGKNIVDLDKESPAPAK